MYLQTLEVTTLFKLTFVRGAGFLAILYASVMLCWYIYPDSIVVLVIIITLYRIHEFMKKKTSPQKTYKKCTMKSVQSEKIFIFFNPIFARETNE